MKDERYDQASLLLEEAMGAQAKDDASMRARKAVNDFFLGRQGRAIEQLGAIFSTSPDLDGAGSSLVVMLMQSRDYARAAQIVDEVVAKQPDNISHLNLQGAAHFANDDLARARAAFAKALSIDPLFLPARLNLAKIDLREGKLEDARSRLEKVLEERPTQVPAMLELARTFEAMGQTDEAVRWAEKALTTDPDAADVAVYLSDLLLSRKEQQRALVVIEDMEMRQPENLAVLEALSRAYLAAGQPSTAQVVLQRATGEAGYDAQRLMRVSALQREAGDLDGAVWALQKAVEGEPDFIPARIRLGELLTELGRYDKAELAARELARDYPDKPYGLHLMGLIQQRQGRNEEALTSYRRALALEDSPILAVRVHGAMVAVEGQEVATRFLEDWMPKHPDDDIVRQALAEVYASAGRWRDAAALYETLLAAAPESPVLLNNLALAYSRLGDPRALEYARKAYALSPNVSEIGDTLGWILVRSGEHTEGLKHLRDAQSRAAGDPGIGYHIAVALSELGRLDEAMRELESVLRLRADFPERADAQALLARLQEGHAPQ